MKNLSLLFVILSIAFSGFGQQQDPVTFIETISDFGTINEEDGPVTHEFKFTNSGETPIRILSVRASCGCTTPGWTKDEIAPGQSGFVKAEYNPANRPGPFNKSLTVMTTASTTPYRLYIKGNVIPKPKSIADELPVVMGGLRVRYKQLNVGKALTSGKPTVRKFVVYNDGNEPITFSEDYVSPKHIDVSFEPMTLPPKERGRIVISYDAKSRNDLGFISDNIIINTDEKSESKKEFYVYATIEEYFPPMSPEEMALAPKLTFEKTTHEFGVIKSGDVVEYAFKFTNTGKKPLNIRKTKASCGCTVAKIGKKDLMPGESSEMTIRFNSTGRKGNQHKSITIYSNDPKAPSQRIMVKANVKE